MKKRAGGLEGTQLAVTEQEYSKTEQNPDVSNCWICWVLLRFHRVSAIKTSVSEISAGKIV